MIDLDSLTKFATCTVDYFRRNRPNCLATLLPSAVVCIGTAFNPSNVQAKTLDAGLVFTIVPSDIVPHVELNNLNSSTDYIAISKATTCIKSGLLSIPYKLRGYGSTGNGQLQLSADNEGHLINYRVSMSNRGFPDQTLDLINTASPVTAPSTYPSCNLSDQYRLEVSVSTRDLVNAGEHVYLDFFTILIAPE